MKTSPLLKRLGPILAEHPQGLPMLRELARVERMADDLQSAEWGTAAAVYWLSYDWHGGQWCSLYAAGCATEYSPSRLCMGIEQEDDYLAQEAYKACEAILGRST